MSFCSPSSDFIFAQVTILELLFFLNEHKIEFSFLLQNQSISCFPLPSVLGYSGKLFLASISSLHLCDGGSKQLQNCSVLLSFSEPPACTLSVQRFFFVFLRHKNLHSGPFLKCLPQVAHTLPLDCSADTL